jgi:hypothetical protein
VNAGAQAGKETEEQPSSNKCQPIQQEELRRAELAISEKRMTMIEDGMQDLKEVIKKQADDIERMAKEKGRMAKAATRVFSRSS